MAFRPAELTILTREPIDRVAEPIATRRSLILHHRRAHRSTSTPALCTVARLTGRDGEPIGTIEETTFRSRDRNLARRSMRSPPTSINHYRATRFVAPTRASSSLPLTVPHPSPRRPSTPTTSIGGTADNSLLVAEFTDQVG